MEKKRLKICLAASIGVMVLVFARCCVSMGRLIYSVQTGENILGGDEIPTWYALLGGDPFVYLGLGALGVCIFSAVRLHRK